VRLSFLSLTYKVPTTTQPPYLHNLISDQPPRITRSSSLVALARSPTSSSLRITDRSFRYASPCLWSQLPSSLRQPHSSPSLSDLPVHAQLPVNSPLSPSITPSLFHSQLKAYLFHKSFPPQTPFLASGLTTRLYDWTVSSEHLGFIRPPCVADADIVFFATKACIDNRKKRVKQQYFPDMSPQYGELRPTSG